LRERKITVSICWKFPHEKFPSTSRALLGTFRAMFSKAFPMYSQTMQTRYTGARVLYAFHEHTGSHLFPRRILTPVKAKAAKCAFQFWFDDLKEMTVVDECSCGTLSRMLSGRNHKKKYWNSSTIRRKRILAFIVYISSFSFFLRRANLLNAKLRDFSLPCMRALSLGLSPLSTLRVIYRRVEARVAGFAASRSIATYCSLHSISTGK